MRIMTGRSYRRRYGNAPGIQRWKRSSCDEAQPAIAVPTIMLNGAADGVVPPESSEHHARATSRRATNVASFRSPDPRPAGLASTPALASLPH